MSYYNSKNPGLLAYLALICLSTIAFIIMPESNIIIGALSVLWGIACMMRVLSLFEVQEYFESYNNANPASKTNNNKAAGLAYDLTKRMHGQNHFKRGLAAMECIDARTLLWFGMASLYALSSFYFGKTNGIESIALLFMIGAAFWLSQSYAYSRTAAYIITALCLSLLSYALMTSNVQIPENIYQAAVNTIISNPASIMLIALIAYSAGVMFHALVENARQAILILSGICLLASLSIAYISLGTASQNMAIWLPAWSLFSLIWIRAYKAPQKRYTLYPC